MDLAKKIFDDFLTLAGLKSIAGPSPADYIQHDSFMKYCADKGLNYDISCSELVELDKAYMRSC